MARPAASLSALLAVLVTLPVASATALDAEVPHTSGRATKKGNPEPPRGHLLGTLVQTHTEERVLLEDGTPDGARFAALLADRVTGTAHPMDPRLVDLLRKLSEKHASPAGVPRIELVSGFRSPKLNEMMRKKGRHVASHSQHSLGQAVDFRVVPAEAERGLDPRELEKEIRGLGWDGGVGVYTGAHDWFVHADVGPNRRWGG